MIQYIAVASHRGAWIEIQNTVQVAPSIRKSRPTGARGLKLNQFQKKNFYRESRPTGARGLKSDNASMIVRNEVVASHRGAWIEICAVHGKCTP